MAKKRRISFRRYFTVKGRRYDARKYGHKAWPIGKRGK